MANSHFASSLQVEVNGAPLAEDVASLLTRAYVDESRNLPDRFVLRFTDPARSVLSRTGIEIGARVRLRISTSAEGTLQQLLSGEVTALEVELDRTGAVTEVRGLDHAHRLFRGRRVAAYPNMTVADIVRQVAKRAGLAIGRIDSPPGPGPDQHSQISQDNVSDWDFLSRLAGLAGAQVTVAEGKLHFLLPEPPDDAPATSAKADQDPLVLEAGSNLISVRAGITAAEQVPEVVGRGWDPTGKRAVEVSAIPALTEAQTGVDPAGLAKTFDSVPFVVADPALTSDAEVRAVAVAVAAQLAGAAVEIDGVARGNPRLRAGAQVALTGLGAPVDGKYTLSGTRHEFSPEAGYTTAFAVSGRRERSLYGLMQGRSHRDTRPWSSLVPAIVSDIRDPLELGRVRVTLPWLDGDYTTGWARMCSLRGSTWLPEVGDEVLAGFAHGDLDTPYVLGCLNNDSDRPPPTAVPAVDGGTGEVGSRALVSRTGHRLELAEPQGIILTTKEGKFALRLNHRDQVVELVSDGELALTAQRGVRIDAGSGALELTGQSVTVQATQAAEVSGMSVSVSGQQSAEVTASGTVTVRGGMVRIN